MNNSEMGITTTIPTRFNSSSILRLQLIIFIPLAIATHTYFLFTSENKFLVDLFTQIMVGLILSITAIIFLVILSLLIKYLRSQFGPTSISDLTEYIDTSWSHLFVITGPLLVEILTSNFYFVLIVFLFGCYFEAISGLTLHLGEANRLIKISTQGKKYSLYYPYPLIPHSLEFSIYNSSKNEVYFLLGKVVGKKEKWYDSYYELQSISIDEKFAKSDQFFLYVINRVDAQKFISLPIDYNLTIDEVSGYIEYFQQSYDDICFIELEHKLIEVGNGINKVNLQ